MPRKTQSLSRTQRVMLRLFGGGQPWIYGSQTTAQVNQAAVSAGGPGTSIFGLSNALNVFQSYTNLSHDRRIKYADYDAMDDTSPEISQILTLYASEVTAPDYHSKRVIWIESKDPKLARRLNAFLDSLHMEERAWGTCRNLAKYGDVMWLNIFLPKEEPAKSAWLKTVKYLHPTRVDRIEDVMLRGFLCEDLRGVIDPGNKEGIFRPWDLVHGRIMAYDNEDIYGRSMIEEVRKIWKMLQILETMVALAHVQRAIERHIFFIDTTGLSDEEAIELVKRYKTWLRKKEYFDPERNEFKSDFNPVTIQEDLFWPTREGDNSRVETLQGLQVPQGLIDDLNYFRNKMISGLGVPRDYVDGEQSSGAFDSKAALALQDVHFARKMLRLQKSFIRMVRHLCQIYMFASEGKMDPKLNQFEVRMGSLSLIEDILNEDRWQKKADVLTQLGRVPEELGVNEEVWREYVVRDILGKDMPRHFIDKLLVGGPEAGESQFPGSDDDDDEPEGSDEIQTRPFVPSLDTGDLTKTALFSSTDEVLAEAFSGATNFGTTDLGILESDFEKLKDSICETYPELRGLAEHLGPPVPKRRKSERKDH